MKNRTFDIYIRLTKEDAADLKRKTKMCGITQSALLRILLKGYEPREKPDDRFYDVNCNLFLYKSSKVKMHISCIVIFVSRRPFGHL